MGGDCTGGRIMLMDVYNSIAFLTADSINSILIGNISCRQSLLLICIAKS